MTESISFADDEAGRFNRLEEWCKRNVREGNDFLFDKKRFSLALEKASEEFGYEFNAVNSLIRNIHLNHVKATTAHVRRNISQQLSQYKQGVSITQLAQQVNYPPYMLCRSIVEAIVLSKRGKKGLTQALKDPLKELGKRSVLKEEFFDSEDQWSDEERNGTTRLAIESQRCIDADPIYGPTHDKKRHCVGMQYEVVLEEYLKEMDIPFETESQLRAKGSSRTPDVLLQVPIGVQVGSEWRVVCWIDSKAMFGDTTTHNTSNLPQAESYVHRFGPGMILYWFGHAPLVQLGNARGDICIAGRLPERFMWPTGELVHNPVTS